jgi:hypothetical protein
VARADRLRASEVAELRERLDTFDVEKLGLAVIERSSNDPWRYHVRELEEASADDGQEVVALR